MGFVRGGRENIVQRLECGFWGQGPFLCVGVQKGIMMRFLGHNLGLRELLCIVIDAFLAFSFFWFDDESMMMVCNFGTVFLYTVRSFLLLFLKGVNKKVKTSVFLLLLVCYIDIFFFSLEVSWYKLE